MRKYRSLNDNKISNIIITIMFIITMFLVANKLRAETIEEVCPMIAGYNSVNKTVTLDNGRVIKIILDSPYETFDDYIVEVYAGNQKLIMFTKMFVDQLKQSDDFYNKSVGYCFESTAFMVD